MEHVTIGVKYNAGKVALVDCEQNGALDNVDIKDRFFLLIILSEGKLEFSVSGKKYSALAPAFLCFGENENPVFLSKTAAEYTCVYFHPSFLNVNMTFELLRSEKYDDIATTHDMFMLKPFIDKAYVIPIVDTQVEKIRHAADCMGEELKEQRDWYWSCRGRSYFMEIIITLERMYGIIGYGMDYHGPDNTPIVKNPRLRNAILYIEGHYGEKISLSDIANNVGLNQTSLTRLIKAELDCTLMEYLTQYRITVAKKQLAFTEVPIKDIASRVGFKTVQHFNRTFREHTGLPPAEFRKSAIQKRKDEIK